MMSFFSVKKQDHVTGPRVENIQVTFENVCSELRDPIYDDGVDSETMCHLLGDIYAYITGTNKGKALRLPAPVADLGDRHRTMWPEGSMVRTRSRRDSHASRTSSRASGGARVPTINPAYTSSKASSNTGSRYAPVRAVWIEGEAPDNDVRNFNMNSLRSSMPRDSSQYSLPRNSNQYIEQGQSYGNIAPIPSRRPTVRMRQPVFTEEDEVEHINTRANINRAPPRNSGTTTRNTRQSKFAEDEE